MRADNVLIVAWDGGGNIPPAIALAQRLVERGHRVRVSGPESIRPAVEAAGAVLALYRTVEAVPRTVHSETNWERIDAILNGPRMVADLLADDLDEPIGTIVVDSMSGAGLGVAESLGLPTAVFVHTLYQPYRSWGPAVVNVRETREHVGLGRIADGDFGPSVLDRADIVLALVPRSFDFPLDTLAPNTHYVGPILAPGPAPTPPATVGLDWRPSPGRPTVLISLGTTMQRQRDAIPPVLDAMGRLDVDGLLTMSDLLPLDSITAPANVTVRGHIPHAAVFPQVNAVLSHGGLSTIMGALSSGRPLVVIPQGRDQDANAVRVAATGVGIALPIDAPAEAIAAAIREVLVDPSYAEVARRFATEIDALGRGSLATDLVEALIEGRRPRVDKAGPTRRHASDPRPTSEARRGDAAAVEAR